MKGFGTILLLFISFSLLSILGFSLIYSHNTLKINAYHKQSILNSIKKSNGLLSSFENQIFFKTNDFYNCTLSIEKNQNKICIAKSKYNLDQQVINMTQNKIFIDYNYYFKDFLDCEQREITKNELNSIYFSNFDCINFTNLADKVALKENIKNLIYTSKHSHPQILSSLGFIQIETLMINSNLLVIAGGDIKINTIINTSDHPVYLTFVSAKGKISLFNYSNDVYLKIFTTNYEGTVPNYSKFENFMLPKILNSSVLGILEE